MSQPIHLLTTGRRRRPFWHGKTRPLLALVVATGLGLIATAEIIAWRLS